MHVNATALPDNASSPGEILLRQHHELFDALVGVLHKYYENSPTDQLLEMVAELVERTRTNFLNEEAFMERLGCALDAAHMATHQGILDWMESLRECVERSDRGRLLPKLLFLDRWLTAHIVGARQQTRLFDNALASLHGRRRRMPVPSLRR